MDQDRIIIVDDPNSGSEIFPADCLQLDMYPNDFSDLSDEQLIQLSRTRGHKDDRPITELIRRHERMVWQICFSYFENADDAEDVSQEVFFKAYLNLRRFEGRSSFKTWLFRIAVNTCHNERRRRSRRPQLAGQPVEDLEDSIPEEKTVEIEWQRSRQREALEWAMQELRPAELEILLMRDLEGRSYKEIASQLGLSLSATKMRIHRARLSLQNLYSQTAEGKS